jgi:hypothetical protein
MSDGYKQKLAIECLIINRKAQQVFTAERRDGQACREIEPGKIGGSPTKGDQLCGHNGNAYDCPNLVRK